MANERRNAHAQTFRIPEMWATRYRAWFAGAARRRCASVAGARRLASLWRPSALLSAAGGGTPCLWCHTVATDSRGRPKLW